VILVGPPDDRQAKRLRGVLGEEPLGCARDGARGDRAGTMWWAHHSAVPVCGGGVSAADTRGTRGGEILVIGQPRGRVAALGHTLGDKAAGLLRGGAPPGAVGCSRAGPEMRSASRARRWPGGVTPLRRRRWRRHGARVVNALAGWPACSASSPAAAATISRRAWSAERCRARAEILVSGGAKRADRSRGGRRAVLRHQSPRWASTRRRPSSCIRGRRRSAGRRVHHACSARSRAYKSPSSRSAGTFGESNGEVLLAATGNTSPTAPA